MKKPVIAVAIGDSAGIGPEIALAAALDERVRAGCRPVLVGSIQILEFYRARFELPWVLRAIAAPGEANFAVGTIDVVDVDGPPLDSFAPGESGAACGRAILDYAVAAIDFARDGSVDGVVASPQTQQSIAAAGIAFDGYPGFVAARTGTNPDDVFMMLHTDTLRIVHTTLHVGVRTALDLIDTDRVARALRATDRALRSLGIERPRIGVAGINPHAGEGGLFGSEDAEIVQPAVAVAAGEGIDAHGPFGADTLLLDRTYDAYVVMFHDQGHIPAKLTGFDAISAFAIGTPIRFASVGHGSALDIAGQGIADPSSLIRTIERISGVAAGDSR
jgi:4-hydroxy-L-threonine phosphate dehydrogenase PdxA